MVEDVVLCARAAEKNKFTSEPEPTLCLHQGPENDLSFLERPKRLLTYLHNRKAMGEPFQSQYSIYFNSPHMRTGGLTTDQNSITLKKHTIAHDGTYFAN